MTLIIYCQNRAESENDGRLLRRLRYSFLFMSVSLVQTVPHDLCLSYVKLSCRVQLLSCDMAWLMSKDMYVMSCHVFRRFLSSPIYVMYPVYPVDPADVDRQITRNLVISRITRLVSGLTTSYDPPFVWFVTS